MEWIINLMIRQTIKYLFLIGLTFLTLVAFSFSTDRVAAQGPLDKLVFLPLVIKSNCLSNNQEQQIADLLTQDPNQQRISLTCHPILAAVAHQRAEDMATRGYFSHTTPEGFGPNYLVSQAGYVLPSFYSTALDANNIESIAAGNSTASATWQQWMSSTPHRTHLLGLEEFYADQIEYGIGFAYNANAPYRYYWVVITAKPGP
jgi:uncharacterized protein YkwD